MELCSSDRRAERVQDHKKWLMLNGHTHEILKEEIAREFKKPETIEDLQARILPLNILRKINEKQSGVYNEPPIRNVVDKNTDDEALVQSYTEVMALNLRMKEANKYFKLNKRTLMEVYANEKGEPQVRNLPKHTYEVYSFSKLSPSMPQLVCVILNDDKIDAEKSLFALWTDESYMVVNGRGDIKFDIMQELNNAELVNPYGKLPFVYINESSLSVDPIQNDDLVKASIVVPLIITDLCFAQKYMSWGIIYTIGEVGDVPVNPNSVLPMQYGMDGQKPEIGTIKPEVDTDKVLMLVKTIIAIVLSTNNLSVGSIKFDLNAQDVASGVAKILDSAESIEDKRDQQGYFHKAEKDLWSLLKDYMVPYWRQTNKLSEEFNKEFSQSFEIQVIFQEPKALVSDQEKVDLAKKRLESGFSTLARELAFLYPHMSREEIANLEQEILDERDMIAQRRLALRQDATTQEDDQAVAS
jgi:hypothetical protein